MLPKVQAAMTFAKLGSGRKAIIASLYNAVDALKGNSGTAVTLE
jgi:carbamate kinase